MGRARRQQSDERNDRGAWKCVVNLLLLSQGGSNTGVSSPGFITREDRRDTMKRTHMERRAYSPERRGVAQQEEDFLNGRGTTMNGEGLADQRWCMRNIHWELMEPYHYMAGKHTLL